MGANQRAKLPIPPATLSIPLVVIRNLPVISPVHAYALSSRFGCTTPAPR